MEKPVSITAEVQGIDEITKKVERYIELLKEAKSLADELASTEFEITLGVDSWNPVVDHISDNY
ncbi:hypothetical protein KUA55_10375 [Enterococcus sp. ALS3]|uniref:Uncharacterized protein n=1 Tax=Enterococcus alishanensis TaxID=1303817 RepID=A0ABS6TDZ6_9ENTE|nr:hypothetical protein [Enterococcus alishanensis]MBV7391087.1 hypothetical protein [Enterococcus alishanensis]